MYCLSVVISSYFKLNWCNLLLLLYVCFSHCLIFMFFFPLDHKENVAETPWFHVVLVPAAFESSSQNTLLRGRLKDCHTRDVKSSLALSVC